MSDLDVTIGLDASDAERGAQTVRRSLQDIKAKANELNTSLTELGRSQRTIDSVISRFGAAYREVGQLGTRLRELGATSQEIGQLTRAFGQLERGLVSNVGNVNKLNDVFRKFNSEMGKSHESANRYAADLDQAKGRLNALAHAADQTGKQLSYFGAGTATKLLSAQLDKLQSQFSSGVGIKQATVLLDQFGAKLAYYQNRLSELQKISPSSVKFTNQGIQDAINRAVGRGSTGVGGPEDATKTKEALGALRSYYQGAAREAAALSAAEAAADRVRQRQQQTVANYIQREQQRAAALAASSSASQRLASATEGTSGAVKRATDRILSHSYSLRGFQGLIWSTVGAVQAFTAAFAFREITQTIGTLQQVQIGLQAVKGSIDAGNERFRFAEQLAGKYGLSLIEVSRGLAKFEAAAKGSGFTAKEINGIFDNTSAAIRTLGLNSQDTEGIFRAFEQMMSKGKIMAEELRLQLGDRLPGAFNIMAEAVGVTTAQLDKMLEQGQVTTRHLIRFAEVLRQRVSGQDSLKNSLESIPAQMDLLRNSFTNTADEIGRGGFTKAVTDAAKGMREFLDSSQGKQLAQSFGAAVHDLVDIFKVLARNIDLVAAAFTGLALTRVVASFLAAGSAVGVVTGAVNALTVALMRNPFTALAVGVTAIATAAVTMNDGFTQTDRLTRRLQDSTQGLANIEKEVGDVLYDIDSLRKSTNGTTFEGISVNGRYAKSLLEIGVSAEEAALRLTVLQGVQMSKKIEKEAAGVAKAKESLDAQLKSLRFDVGDYLKMGQTGAVVIRPLMKEIAQAVDSGDLAAAQAAVQRARKKVFNSPFLPDDFRQEAENFVRRYYDLLASQSDIKAKDIKIRIDKAIAEAFKTGQTDQIKTFMDLYNRVGAMGNAESLRNLGKNLGVTSRDLQNLKNDLVGTAEQISQGNANWDDFVKLVVKYEQATKDASSATAILNTALDSKKFDPIVDKLNATIIGMGGSKAEALEFTLALKGASSNQVAYATGLQTLIDKLKDYKKGVKEGSDEVKDAAEKDIKATMVTTVAAATMLKRIELQTKFADALRQGGQAAIVAMRQIELQTELFSDTFAADLKKRIGNALDEINTTTEQKGAKGLNNSFNNQKARMEEIIDSFIGAKDAAQNYYDAVTVGGLHFSDQQRDQLASLKGITEALKGFEAVQNKAKSASQGAQFGASDSEIKRFGKAAAALKDYKTYIDELKTATDRAKDIDPTRRAGLQNALNDRTKEYDELLKQNTESMKTYTAAVMDDVKQKDLANTITALELKYGDDAAVTIANLTALREKEGLAKKYQADMSSLLAQKAEAEKAGNKDLANSLSDAISAREALYNSEKTTQALKNTKDIVQAELKGPMGKMFKSMWDEVEDGLKDAFKNGFVKGESFFKSLLSGLKSMFKNFLAELAFQAIAKPIIVPVFQALGGAMGLSDAAVTSVTGSSGSTGIGGQTQNIGNALSLGKTVYSLATGGSGLAATQAAGSFATSSLGQTLGLSTSAAGVIPEAAATDMMLTSSGNAVVGAAGTIGAAMPYGMIGGFGGSLIGNATGSKALGALSGAALGAGSAGIGASIWGMGAVGGPWGIAAAAIISAVMAALGTQKPTVGPTASADVTVNRGGKTATYGNVQVDNEGDPAQGKALGQALSGIFSLAALGGGSLAKNFGIGQTAAKGLYVGGSVPYKEFGDDVGAALRYMLLDQGGLKDGGVNTLKAIRNTTAKDWEEATKDIALGSSIDAGITAMTEFDKSLKGVENSAKKAAEANYSNVISEKERADKLGLGGEYADLLTRQFRDNLKQVDLTPLRSNLATLDGQFEALTNAVHTMGLAISDSEIAAAKAAQAEKLLKEYRDQFDSARYSAQGIGVVNDAMTIRGRWNTNWQDDLAAGRDPTDLYRDQMKNLFSGIEDLTVLNKAAKALKDLDEVAAAFAEARAAEVRDAQMTDLTQRLRAAQVILGQVTQEDYDRYQMDIDHAKELAGVTDEVVRARLIEVQTAEKQALASKQAAEAANKAAEAQKEFATASESTRSYLLSLLTGASGGLSVQDRYRNAQNEYASASAAIGPQATAEQLARQTEAAKALLDASRAMNGSTTEYFRDLANVSGDLAKSAQITPDDPVVTAINALKASVDGLGGSITVQVSVDAINFVRGEIEQTIKTHVSTAGLSLREIQLANGVLDAVNQSVTVALSPATGLTARELQLYQGALSNIDQSITAAVDTSALTGANREIALGKLSDATRTINTALGVFPTMTAEQREFVLGASRDFARTVNGTLGVMPNLSAEQQAILLGQSDSFSRTFDAMAGKAPSLSAEQAAILSGTSDSFSRTFNGLVGVLPAMTGDQRAILLGVSDSFTRVYQQAVGVLPGMSYEQRAILTGYTDSFTKTFQSAAAAMPSMSMDQLAILRGQTDDFTRTFIAATNDLKLTPDEQAVLTAKSEQISRTITQKVETTETVDISRSIDDKLSKILDEIKAQMVAANTNLVTVNKSVIALASPNNPITVTSLFKGGAGMSFETGGVIPGGVIGNGIWGKDSVMARYAGGGVINLAGGEGVLTAAATQAIGGIRTIEEINRTLSLPSVTRASLNLSEVQFPVSQYADQGSGNSQDLVDAVRKLKEEVAAFRKESSTLAQKKAQFDEEILIQQTEELKTALVSQTKRANSAA